MTHLSYAEFQENLSRYVDEAVDTRSPVVVTRQGDKGNVVMMAEEEFAGWQEIVHLLSSPRNAARLLRSVREAAKDDTSARNLLSLNLTPEA